MLPDGGKGVVLKRQGSNYVEVRITSGPNIKGTIKQGRGPRRDKKATLKVVFLSK